MGQKRRHNSTRFPPPRCPPSIQICARCGAHRATLYEIEPEKLKVPDVSFPDFKRAARKTKPSVAVEELERFQKWTDEFGIEG